MGRRRMTTSQLEALRPTSKRRLIDLVEYVGIDISDWANYKGGRAKAAANPRYCYNWAFLEGDLVVLNLWHSSIEAHGPNLILREELRPGRKVVWTRDRTGPAMSRGLALDTAIRTAFERRLNVRMVIIDGTPRRNASGPGSVVTGRDLDPVTWGVTAYDTHTGAFKLSRGRQRGKFADQYTDEDEGMAAPPRRERSSFVYERDPRLRKLALTRAQGVCELCARPGFLRADGRIFLEVHHVQALGAGGADSCGNMVALCANDHREAHYGSRADEIKQSLLRVLRSTRRG